MHQYCLHNSTKAIPIKFYAAQAKSQKIWVGRSVENKNDNTKIKQMLCDV